MPASRETEPRYDPQADAWAAVFTALAIRHGVTADQARALWNEYLAAMLKPQ